MKVNITDYTREENKKKHKELLKHTKNLNKNMQIIKKEIPEGYKLEEYIKELQDEIKFEKNQ